MNKLFFLLIGLLLIVQGAQAQDQAGTGFAVLEADVGARALGMGGAFSALADNADAPYWNPAGLGWVASSEITTMQTKLSTDADHYYVSYVRPAFGGAIGLAWVQLGLGNLVLTSGEVGPNNEVQPLGACGYFSSAYLFSYGRKLTDRLSVGLTGRYLVSDMSGVGGGQASGYSLAPGLLWRPGDNFNLGARLDDAVNQQTWGTGAAEQASPKLHLGLAYRSLSPGTFSLEISQVVRAAYAPEVCAGYEWANNFWSFRTGWMGGGLTAGAGFALAQARVDYAYVNQPDLTVTNVHRISLSGRW